MKVLNIVNYKLIKRSYKSNLSIINNNINKDYEIEYDKKIRNQSRGIRRKAKN